MQCWQMRGANPVDQAPSRGLIECTCTPSNRSPSRRYASTEMQVREQVSVFPCKGMICRRVGFHFQEASLGAEVVPVGVRHGPIRGKRSCGRTIVPQCRVPAASASTTQIHLAGNGPGAVSPSSSFTRPLQPAAGPRTGAHSLGRSTITARSTGNVGRGLKAARDFHMRAHAQHRSGIVLRTAASVGCCPTNWARALHGPRKSQRNAPIDRVARRGCFRRGQRQRLAFPTWWCTCRTLCNK